MPFKDEVQRKLYMRAYRKRQSSTVKKKSEQINLDSFLEKVRNCSNCKNKPKVLLMVREEKIGVCKEHGNAILESDVEW